jgi:hypothetical protein
MSIRASFSHETRNFSPAGMQELNYLQRDPEFVAEAEKTRMTLNPIPVPRCTTRSSKGCPSRWPSKKSSSRSLRRRVSKTAGYRFRIRSILGSSAVSSFPDRNIPPEPEVIELFKKLTGNGPASALVPFTRARAHANRPRILENRIKRQTGRAQHFCLDARFEPQRFSELPRFDTLP